MMRLRGTRLSAVTAAGVAAALLAGCAGPSTRVLPREATAAYEVPEEQAPVLEEPNPFYLQEALTYLSRTPRECGSLEETGAAGYLSKLLRDYGYQVELQKFPGGPLSDGPGVTGTNVTAVLKAQAPDADILLITAHHDTAKLSPGANESAAGAVTLLESARLLSQMPTDTELWFVSFGGSHEGRAGERYFLDNLPETDRSRVIGAVCLDALGYVEDDRVEIGTVDGGNTLIGDLLQSASKEQEQGTWQYARKPVGPHALFVNRQIPAALVGQQTVSFESGTTQDKAGIVDVEKLARAVEVVTGAAAGVMSPDTPSLLAKSRFQNNMRDGVFVQAKDMPFFFGEDRLRTETEYGLTGELLSSNTDGAGDVVDNYRYRMKWFDVDQVILTDYHYLNGKLDTISLDADGAGITFGDMKERLISWYGDPVGENTGPDGTEYDWTDPLYGKFLALIPVTGGFETEIRPYRMEETVLGGFAMDGTDLGDAPDTRRAQLFDLVKKLIAPEDYEKIAGVRIFTDGVGGRSGYAEPAAEPQIQQPDGDGQPDTEKPRYTLSLDLEDAITPEGRWRNRTETVRLVTRLYGQILAEYGAGSYTDAFAAQFGGTPDVDFAEAFSLFALCQKPEEPTAGTMDAQIRFFYEQEPFVKIRAGIRKALNLQEEQA